LLETDVDECPIVLEETNLKTYDLPAIFPMIIGENLKVSTSRLLMIDGHMWFHAGRNKNITFKTSGDGSIFIDRTDISKLPELVRDLFNIYFKYFYLNLIRFLLATQLNQKSAFRGKQRDSKTIRSFERGTKKLFLSSK
uniref:BPI2 domain-containing protein n=1 Tax=Angiostrongylus cantonensis TaxID=6313 RepID=A0A0K0CZG3_ANGCA